MEATSEDEGVVNEDAGADTTDDRFEDDEASMDMCCGGSTDRENCLFVASSDFVIPGAAAP